MNAKLNNKDRIYMYMYGRAVAINKLDTETLFRSGNAGFCKLMINFALI